MASMTQERKTELLTQFNENAELKEALKEELLKGIYSNGVIKEGEKHDPLKNWALSLAFRTDDGIKNAQIGEKLVAIAEGIRFLESSFNDIEANYKPVVAEEGKPKNPAR